MSTAVQWLIRQLIGVELFPDANLPFSSLSIVRTSGKQAESEVPQSMHLGVTP